ncbi:MAG TPA: DUF542 domain-containing protein [Planctomycetota bacterium]|jgi:regulator of cell morphogenesis and NO signaling|nr:DUF542 domain-containing protein [Planctomycetota bacterium]
MKVADGDSMTLDPSMTAAEIARRYPSALKVFARHRIDLCCGGRKSLAEIARLHGIDLKALIEELLSAIQEAA